MTSASTNLSVKTTSTFLQWGVAVFLTLSQDSVASPAIIILLYSLILLLGLFALGIEFAHALKASKRVEQGVMTD